MSVVIAPAQEVPVVKETDVIVCGGGPAGIGAALAAARSGAKTVLIEGQGCLGGVWTTGCLSWILDNRDKPGLLVELIEACEKRGIVVMQGNPSTGVSALSEGVPHAFGIDVEKMKLLLEEMCIEAGIDIRLYTRISSALVNEQTITHVITESKSGAEAWSAKQFIDCTGDGDLGARAGCQFTYGREETANPHNEAQPMSLLTIVDGLKADEIERYHRFHQNMEKYNSEDSYSGLAAGKHRFREQMEKAGAPPSYSKPTMFKMTDSVWTMMLNHEYGKCGFDAQDLTDATIHARAEINHGIDALRKTGGVFKDIHLTATANHIGVREGRRIKGRYTVTSNDVVQGVRHEDAVCRVHFGIDVHSTNPKNNKGIHVHGLKAQPYDIPLRALIAQDVDNLFMAGRCISGDFMAHSSYRVTGNAVALGQAAGTAAAIAGRKGVSASQVSYASVKTLMDDKMNANGPEPSPS